MKTSKVQSAEANEIWGEVNPDNFMEALKKKWNIKNESEFRLVGGKIKVGGQTDSGKFQHIYYMPSEMVNGWDWTKTLSITV